MITCPNCNHQNPEGAQQCEACYTPLPAMVACPSCGTPVQENASFCGQCGNDLRGIESAATAATPTEASVPESSIPTENFLNPKGGSVSGGSVSGGSVSGGSAASGTGDNAAVEIPDLVAPDPLIVPDPIAPEAEPSAEAPASTPSGVPPASAASPISSPASPASPAVTQLQVLSARLRHAQTDTTIEIPKQLSVVRIGKPNDQMPPDIDVSGFSDSDIVSRVHANLRVEGDVYYLEDVGSSNGTYVNGMPIAVGNRHRLRAGDRFALGKGDKVSFIFETS